MAQSIAPLTAQRMNRLIVALLVLAVVYFGFDKFVLAPKREAALVATTSQVVKAETLASATKASDNSIAVLPFVDMSQAKDQEYFSDGLSEEILNLLAQIRDLKVIGRTSSFAFKGRNEDLRTIGNTLGVAYLLEGSVRKSGQQLAHHRAADRGGGRIAPCGRKRLRPQAGERVCDSERDRRCHCRGAENPT